MSSSDIYAHETQLADRCEMLMRYMQRKGVWKTDKSRYVSFWELFTKEYPSYASDMEEWLKAKHDKK